MTTASIIDDPLGEGDDIVAAFQIHQRPVRGRIARMGDATLDAILKRHDYPHWAAHLLGEGITLAVLVAASLKSRGKVTVQAQGDGPVALMVGEARTDGGVRGYLRIDKEKWERLDRVNKGGRPDIQQAIGAGRLSMILSPEEEGQEPYQGIVPLEGTTLAECAQTYFAQSEQVPTRIRLAVAEFSEGGGERRWRSGGALIQQVAGDDARGDTEDAWNTASILFDTVTDLELADPDLSAGRLLFRLFNEDGVVLEPPKALADSCTCSEERVIASLSGLTVEEVRSLANESGAIEAGCQFCGRTYRIPVTDVDGV